MRLAFLPPREVGLTLVEFDRPRFCAAPPPFPAPRPPRGPGREARGGGGGVLVPGYSDEDVTVAAGGCFVAGLVAGAGEGGANPFTDLKRACITLCRAGTGATAGSGARVAADFFFGIRAIVVVRGVRTGCDATTSLYRADPFGTVTAYEPRGAVHRANSSRHFRSQFLWSLSQRGCVSMSTCRR